MTGIIEDECWVCGTLMKNRCSACSNRDPGVDIFLCSRGGQKLLNPIHRIFCGNERTNPFLFHPLTRVELEHRKSIREVAFKPKEDDRAISLEAEIARYSVNGHKVHGRKAQGRLLDALSQQEARLSDSSTMLMCSIVRAFLYQYNRQGANSLNLTPCEFAVAHCSVMFYYKPSARWFGSKGTPFIAPPAYITALLHRLYMYAYLVEPSVQDLHAPLGQDISLEIYVSQHVQPADPKQYAALTAVFEAARLAARENRAAEL